MAFIHFSLTNVLACQQILYCALNVGLLLTASATAEPLFELPLETKIQSGNVEGSGLAQFLCNGYVVNEEAGFNAPACSLDYRFITMHEAATADLQLDFFPIDDVRLLGHKRLFGDSGGRFCGFMAWIIILRISS